ncbi:RAD9B protein, partial [Glareola pratincola]|nr:RAD9B protein [Glareola pratincola]
RILHCFLFLLVFGRAIHAIARVSDEFWFDPVEKGLALRSVNSSRSAYASVFFSSMFFQHYCWTAVSQPCQREKQLSLPCKLIIKSVLPVFRCVNVLERNVEKCSISTNINDHHITFQLLCKHGVVKTYNLTFQECDPLQAVFAKHMCPNILKVHSRLLADVMIHFPTSQEEVTLSVTPMKVCFKSYTEEDTDFSKTMLTEIQLNPEEFDYFQVGVDCEVTFCLKELRGLLAFSEATGVPVSIHFDISGKPIAFSAENMVLEASFILATLCDIEKETASQQPPCFSQQQESNAAAVAFKKPQWNGNAPSTEPAKPASPLAKQEVKNIPRVTEGETPGIEGAALTEAEDHAPLGREAAESHSQETGKDFKMAKASLSHAVSYFCKYCVFQFHSLFFGAVSCTEKDAISHTFHSLATASDTEEDFGSSQI